MLTTLPIIDRMLKLYQEPASPDRFNSYLRLLQGGTKGDMKLPISHFNPMAKAHILEQLTSLKELNAEDLVTSILKELTLQLSFVGTYQVALNLADDLLGGWTHKFTTDYSARFELNPFIERNFIVTVLWSSESHPYDLIRERTIAAVYRSYHWLQEGRPITLRDHILQEAFATHTLELSRDHQLSEELKNQYLKLQHSTSHSEIFNFLYGDEVCESLGYKIYGVHENLAGLIYAQALAKIS